jgi:hypothetical protein
MKFLTDADLRARGIKYSRAHRWRLIKQGKFPHPVLNGMWVEDEIDAYQQACVAARNEKLAEHDTVNASD